jgi:hypothetical protein
VYFEQDNKYICIVPSRKQLRLPSGMYYAPSDRDHDETVLKFAAGGL